MTITLFTGVSTATGAQLDANLTAVSNQAPIPCTASGTNAIALTQEAGFYTVTAYGNNMQFSAVAAGNNSGPVTAQLGSLGALNVYKDSAAGPVALTGNEIISGNAFTLLYDIALNSGAGGFHLFTNTGQVGTPINPSSIQIGSGSVLHRYLTATASVSFSVFGANSAQEVTVALAGVSPLDAVQVGPPSMALAALSFIGYVPASGSVNLRAINAAGATVSLTPGIFRVTAMG